MVWSYSTAVINDRLQAVIDNIDAHGGHGRLQLLTAGGAVLSTITLARPSATILSSAGIMVFDAPLTDASATGGGTAALAQITDSFGTVIVPNLTVGVSSATGDVVVSLLNIAAGSMVTFLSGTVTGR